MDVQSRDEDAPVTVATYPNPHEAYLDRAALESQGIAATVQTDHGQYASIASWVQLQVALRDRELARELLEVGPFSTGNAAKEPTAAVADDLRPVRLRRRFILARWFLYVSALTVFLTSWFWVPLFLIPIGLALWSRKHPRYAFGSAYFIQIVVVFVSISLAGLSGLTTLIPLVAYYWAWAGAKPDPPNQLLASPIPMTREIEIGQAWEEGEASREPGEHPLWILRDLGILAFVVLVIWAVREAM